MPSVATLLAFGLIALGLALTPGPNMLYLASRSISQGRRAGLVSLAGVGVGFLFYMLCAALGITALVFAIPYAYDALRFGGAVYLGYLAWQALRPSGRAPFAVRALSPDSPRRLFAMGLVTNLLNPKAAVLYLSLLPQFVVPGKGSVLLQSVLLGAEQITISMAVNALVVIGAGRLAAFLGTRPTWASLQRWLMGTVLAALAVRMATAARR